MTTPLPHSYAPKARPSPSTAHGLGTKGGIRLQYGGDFKVYTTKDGKLYDYTPEYESTPMFQNEINAFVACVQSGEKLASHIDRNILTSKLMQGIYDSSDTGREVVID